MVLSSPPSPHTHTHFGGRRPLQILFHSSQLSLLTAAAEVSCALMYPLQWPHVYIPVLPRGLVQVLQAPMPFIIGLPTDRYVSADDRMLLCLFS